MKSKSNFNESNYVIKANKFIEAKGRLGVLEQKFMGALISQISTDDEDFKEYKLDIKEVAEFINLSSNAIYEQIKITARNLKKKEIFIDEVDEKGKKSFLVTSLISSAKYKEGKGYIEIRIDPNLKPYLIAINGKNTYFTKYMIKNILKLNSSYSIRIYELLKQYENMKNRDFIVEKLKEFIGISNEYKRFYDFEKYVLKPAKNEINEKTDIWITYEKIKEGRKITKLKFEIEPKFVDEKKELIDNLYSESELNEMKLKSGMRDSKFSSKQFIEVYEIACKMTDRFNLDPYKYIELNYLYMMEKENVNNPCAYLKKILQEDIANARLTMLYEEKNN